MATYGYADLKIEFDNAAAGVVDMSAYITSVNGDEIEAILEEITAAGDDFARWATTAFKRMAEVTLGGPFDDTASTGPDVIFNAIGNTTTRTLKFTYGGTKTLTVETIIKAYRVNMAPAELSKFEVVLQPTGTFTLA